MEPLKVGDLVLIIKGPNTGKTTVVVDCLGNLEHDSIVHYDVGDGNGVGVYDNWTNDEWFVVDAHGLVHTITCEPLKCKVAFGDRSRLMKITPDETEKDKEVEQLLELSTQ